MRSVNVRHGALILKPDNTMLLGGEVRHFSVSAESIQQPPKPDIQNNHDDQNGTIMDMDIDDSQPVPAVSATSSVNQENRFSGFPIDSNRPRVDTASKSNSQNNSRIVVRYDDLVSPHVLSLSSLTSSNGAFITNEKSKSLSNRPEGFPPQSGQVDKLADEDIAYVDGAEDHLMDDDNIMNITDLPPIVPPELQITFDQVI